MVVVVHQRINVSTYEYYYIHYGFPTCQREKFVYTQHWMDKFISMKVASSTPTPTYPIRIELTYTESKVITIPFYTLHDDRGPNNSEAFLFEDDSIFLFPGFVWPTI
jgi:hypothetical protein